MQKFLFLCGLIYQVSILWLLDWESWLGRPIPLQAYKAIFPCFLLVFYVFLFCFTFKSLIQLEFILVYSVSYGSNSIFLPDGWHFKLRSDLVRMGASF